MNCTYRVDGTLSDRGETDTTLPTILDHGHVGDAPQSSQDTATGTEKDNARLLS